RVGETGLRLGEPVAGGSEPSQGSEVMTSIIWNTSLVPGKLRPPHRQISAPMIKVKRIDHVAVAVADRDATAHDLSAMFGLGAGAREHVAGQKTDVAFLHTRDAADGATDLEICAPAGNPALERFLAKRGPGLHHVCFEVDDLRGALATLKAAGVRLIDETPRPGARGHLVAFLHPAATRRVLFDHCQHAHPGSPAVSAPS